MRQVNYNVSFVFASDDRKYMGGIAEHKMSFHDVCFLFHSLSPLKSIKWVANITHLRRGGSVQIETLENDENGRRIIKMYKVVRV